MVDGVATARLPVDFTGKLSISPMLMAGPHATGVRYDGDRNYLPSSSGTLNLAVDKAATMLTMSFKLAQLNQTVSILVFPKFVLPPYDPVNGTVDFSNAADPIPGCTNIPVQAGVAVCRTSFSRLGTFTINASYSGDANAKPSAGSLLLTVDKVVAGMYIASAPDAPVFGAPVMVNVLLLGATGVAVPTGTVAFSDGTVMLSSSPVGVDGRAPLVVTAPFSVGAHSITAVYSGDANYQKAGIIFPLTFVVAKAKTILALASTPAQIDQPVTLKTAVTVVSPGSATPGGSLDFSNAGKPIAGCTGLLPQNGIATCNISLPQLGDYSIGASYSGDANTAPSTASLRLTVGKAVASIYTAATPATPVFGVPVKVNALLLGATGIPSPTGTVTFSDGATVWAPVPVGADGRASLSQSLGVGPHSFVAIYDGDANYAGSTAPAVNLTVQKASTSTILTASLGGPFTAAITVAPPGAGTPTGMVQFFQGSTPFGTAPVGPVGSGFAAMLPAGPQLGSIRAVYQGDANFSGSSSQAVTVATAAQVSIVSGRNPVIAGQQVTFTVAVGATGAAASAPTGIVQLSAGSANLGTATLAGGQAIFTATLAAGPHTLAATYSGDSMYSAGAASLALVVSQPMESLNLTASPAATVYGQAIALTAQGTVATGTVQFSDGATALGSARASGGIATLVVANLSAGPHSLTAIWTGEDNSAAAVSLPLPQTVNKAQTSTALALSGLSLTAVVTVLAPGAGAPTGTVKFLDAATNAVLGSAVLAGGSAVTPLSSTAGPMMAIYSGDNNFQNSSSGPLTPLAAVNAASYAATSFAPDEIVTLFGSNLGTTTVSATAGPSLSLGGTTLAVTDSAGVPHAAGILFVSPSQASFLMPADTAAGPAIVIVTNANRAALSTTLTVAPVAPGLFTLNSTGQGAPAGQIIRVHDDGTQDAPQDVAVFDKVQNQWVPAPIDLGAPTDSVYLILYGTGFRHYSAMPVCTIAGQPILLAFAGAQGGFPGLDQVNLVLPQSLRGAGTVDVRLTVDSAVSNSVTLAFQ